MTARWLARHARFFAIAFAFGAVNHAIALASPSAADASPPWRHALFLALNLLFTACFALRFRWTIVPLVPLVAQQLYSHGTDLLRAAQAGAFDGASLAVVIVMPTAALAAVGLLREANASSATSAG